MMRLALAIVGCLALGARILPAAPVAVRDSIGPDNSSTNGNYPFQSTYVADDEFSMTMAQLRRSPQDVVLSEIRGIAAPLSANSPSLGDLGFIVRIWRYLGRAIAFPNDGDIANLYI